MKTLFLSDLHLSAGRPEVTERFLRFLATTARDAERLYILGDLFDAYLGDDDDASPNREVRSHLAALAASGTAVFFQHGNRDFLVGETFAQATGVNLLGDYAVVEVCGVPTLITHGDLLCTDDVQYQSARARVRTPTWKGQALAKPLWLRRLYARWYRFKSGIDKSGKSANIMDVNPGAVIETMNRFGVKRLIHGHTHRPGIHDVTVAGAAGQRFVLAAWDERGLVLGWDEKGFALLAG